jgi:hypothetical protein
MHPNTHDEFPEKSTTMKRTISPKRVLVALVVIMVPAMAIHFTVRHTFPVEEWTPDNKFHPFSISWEFRDDMVSEVRNHGGGTIKTVIYKDFIFYVFDNRGRVFMMSAGDAGSSPSVSVGETETYSGDPHAHHLKDFPGGA